MLDHGVSQQIVTVSVQWVLLHLVVHWWGKLDKSLMAGGLRETPDDGALVGCGDCRPG